MTSAPHPPERNRRTYADGRRMTAPLRAPRNPTREDRPIVAERRQTYTARQPNGDPCALTLWGDEETD